MAQIPDHQPRTSATPLVRNSAKIAVLIRHREQMPEALRTGKRFCLAGMKVDIFVIGDSRQDSDGVTCEELATRPANHTKWFTCHPADALLFGTETASLCQVAEKIAEADLVLSF
ncbi:MAG: hypothetical protein AMJ54_06345 [Deltaproteobacteria bacterium SG8_13]|nr:MAG: hypothetical protein AMJ54_06345 [Deltaproteobacteria bacterium SG8_13]